MIRSRSSRKFEYECLRPTRCHGWASTCWCTAAPTIRRRLREHALHGPTGLWRQLSTAERHPGPPGSRQHGPGRDGANLGGRYLVSELWQVRRTFANPDESPETEPAHPDLPVPPVEAGQHPSSSRPSEPEEDIVEIGNRRSPFEPPVMIGFSSAGHLESHELSPSDELAAGVARSA